MLNQEQVHFYEKNGYLIVKKAIAIKKIEEFMNFIANIIQIETKRLGIVSQARNEDLLHDIFIKIKNENPISSSWIYQTINNSNVFKKFIYNLGVDPIIQELLHIYDIRHIGTINPALRIDVPNDTHNARDWHQDSNYFFDNASGSDALVTWIPFDKASEENGSVIVCPESHREGRLNSTHIAGTNLASEQYVIPHEIIDKYEKITVDADKGDAVFLNMDIIHRSGFNISNSVRYTAQIRYSNLSKLDYRPPQSSIRYPQYDRI